MEHGYNFFIEDDDEPVKAGEEKHNDDESIGHDLVTSLNRLIMLF